MLLSGALAGGADGKGGSSLTRLHRGEGWSSLGELES